MATFRSLHETLDRIADTLPRDARYYRRVAQLAARIPMEHGDAPLAFARRTAPGMLTIDCVWYNGRHTRYGHVPMWRYGLAWARARRHGHGVGSVLALMRASAAAFDVEVLAEGRSCRGDAARRHVAALAADPGDAGMFAAELERLALTFT